MKTQLFCLIATLTAILALTGSCSKEEDNAVTSVSVSPYSLSLEVGQTQSVTATLNPATAVDPVTWSSSDQSVATVSNGTVTAVGTGTAIITATAGGKSGSCTVTVTKSVESVTLDKTKIELEEEKEVQLTAAISPSDASETNISWSSSDNNIAYVKGGLVTGVSVGKATITAQIGGKTATCEVTVKEPAYKLKERAALIAFYKANNGDNWSEYQKENWCSDKPLGTWAGVATTDDRKHVNYLSLSDKNLYGKIPKEMCDLTELEVFYIVGSTRSYSGSGTIPEEIGSLKKLKRLGIYFYPVKGKIPSSVTQLTNLERLVISESSDMSPQEIPSGISNLKKLKYLSLTGINLKGEIPSEIGSLTNLEELFLHSNKLTGSIPASFSNLNKATLITLYDNNLSGDIPSTINNLENFWMLWPQMVMINNFTQENIRKANIPAPKSPSITSISGKTINVNEIFEQNQYTVISNINPSSGKAVEFLSQLSSFYKTNKSKGLGLITCFDNNSPNESEDLTPRDELFKSVVSKTGIPAESAFIRHMYKDYPQGSAPFYAKTGYAMYPDGSENEVIIIGPDKTVDYATQTDNSSDPLGNVLEYLATALKATVNHYESKSYSQDGKYETLQKATTGKGVNLVITGDAFSDRLITGGTFKKAAQQAMKDFFSVEPMKSLKSRFNVYLVNAVSKNEEYFKGNSTAYSGVFGFGSAVGGDDAKVLQYAKKAIGAGDMDNVLVLVLMNTLRSGGTCYMHIAANESVYAAGPSVCWVPYKDVPVSGGISSESSVIIHEAAGHGLGKLADEYGYYSSGKVSDDEISYVKNYQKKYWYMNVDFTSDPSQVLWSQFIGDSAFASENIGVYEGGDTFWSGVWRPTEQSVMNDNHRHSTFNAPCRSQLYTRIMKLSEGSSWKYDYNAFKTWDKAHPTKVATRSIVEVDENEKEYVHVPPVIVEKTWKEVIGY